MHNAAMNERSERRGRKPEPKPSKLARIKGSLADLLEQLAQRNATSLAIEANRAARLLLEQEGLWPPQPNR